MPFNQDETLLPEKVLLKESLLSDTYTSEICEFLKNIIGTLYNQTFYAYISNRNSFWPNEYGRYIFYSYSDNWVIYLVILPTKKALDDLRNRISQLCAKAHYLLYLFAFDSEILTSYQSHSSDLMTITYEDLIRLAMRITNDVQLNYIKDESARILKTILGSNFHTPELYNLKVKFSWQLPSSDREKHICLIPQPNSTGISWQTDLENEKKHVFTAYYFDSHRSEQLGQLILWITGTIKPSLSFYDLLHQNKSLDVLPENIISIGYTAYYKALQRKNYRIALFTILNDFPYHMGSGEIFDRFSLTEQELRRDKLIDNLDQLKRLAWKEPEFKDYSFTYNYPITNSNTESSAYSITFNVSHNGLQPPTNMYAIIGANGSGKTFLLRNIATSIALDGNNNKIDDMSSYGHILFAKPCTNSKNPYADSFNQIIFITFSTTDSPWTILENKGLDPIKKFEFIGYYSREENVKRNNLVDNFESTMKNLLCNADKKAYWNFILNDLSSTAPQFKQFCEYKSKDDIAKATDFNKKFECLSAGHKAVLYTLAQLIDLVKEDTLVLFDEPEAHLHPPLLASLVRSLSYILETKNGVGILATHSSVVLQEIPRKCVWHLERKEGHLEISHPKIETFGESLGSITHHIFKHELNNSGYRRLLEKIVHDCEYTENESDTMYVKVLNQLDNQLGIEGRSVLLSLLLNKDTLLC